MTYIKVKVIPNSKINKLIEQSDGSYKIKLQAPAIEGKANKALVSFLSEHFKIAKNKIIIISGEKSREKSIKLLI